MGHERLFIDLKRIQTKTKSGKLPVILKLPKSGGVVNPSPEFHRECRKNNISMYFYGLNKPHKSTQKIKGLNLSPYSVKVPFKKFKLFRLGFGSDLSSFLAPSSALPIGESRKVNLSNLSLFEPSDVLLHSILAVVDCDLPVEFEDHEVVEADSDLKIQFEDWTSKLATVNVIGFLYVY